MRYTPRAAFAACLLLIGLARCGEVAATPSKEAPTIGLTPIPALSLPDVNPILEKSKLPIPLATKEQIADILKHAATGGIPIPRLEEEEENRIFDSSVLLMITTPDNTFLCNGALLEDKSVVTADHCNGDSVTGDISVNITDVNGGLATSSSIVPIGSSDIMLVKTDLATDSLTGKGLKVGSIRDNQINDPLHFFYFKLDSDGNYYAAQTSGVYIGALTNNALGVSVEGYAETGISTENSFLVIIRDELVNGNSGLTVTNQNGEIVGVLGGSRAVTVPINIRDDAGNEQKANAIFNLAVVTRTDITQK